MDWADTEFIGGILGKRFASTDLLRFRFVCRSWRSAPRSHPVPPSLPRLCLPNDHTATDLQVYSFSEDRIYTIPFPLACNSYIIGSASGFLLVIGCGKNPKVLIINPFTGHSKRTKELPETTAPRPTYSIPLYAMSLSKVSPSSLGLSLLFYLIGLPYFTFHTSIPCFLTALCGLQPSCCFYSSDFSKSICFPTSFF